MNENMIVVPESDDVEDEAQFETLHEIGYVRGKTDQHQWYLFVNDACSAARIPVDDVVKDYLATMLWRFSKRTELFEQLMAFDFYQHAFGTAKIDGPCVQDVADISLQYVAFFPERSRNRHQPRSLEYIANGGISLYAGLAKMSEGKNDWFSRAYPLMAKSFGRAVMVLRSVHPDLAREREQELRKLERDAVRIPSIKQAPAIDRFNRMYFQSDGPSNRTPN